jgi:transposase
VDGAPNGIKRAKMVVVETPSEGKPSMGKSIRNIAAVTRVGLDLAKNVFQVHGVDAQGEVVIVRKLRRAAVLQFFGRLQPCVVAMEACGSAHHWGREIAALGHEVKLIPPAHVKPYVRRNKTDAADAAAICEAALRPQQRFVPLRTVDNQAELMRHRAREQLVGQRTALLNALRGHLSEIGVIAPQGAQHAYRLKRLAEGDADGNGEIVVCEAVRAALAPLAKQIDALDQAIEAIDKKLEAQAKADMTAKRLMTIPGIGPVTATAIAATIRDIEAFASGREFAAFLGLTPRQISTGGKERSGGVSKMGDRYLRKLLVVGATTVLHHAAGHSDALRTWAKEMLKRKAAHKYAFKLTAVALANKLARIAYAILHSGGTYDDRPVAGRA